MKKRAPFGLGQALSVLIPGALGLAIVGRTLADYVRHDPIASAIVGAMAATLALGSIELLFRQRRAVLLAHEVRGLPANPSEATIDGASALLSGLLRARLEQVPAPALGEGVAPYLTGFLVMLGLLGTLLGLFEAVHGAGLALTMSSDVNALRSGLSTPIDGLTRSFGCSAAGIGASAMLGLAIALVRRREGRVLGAVHSYAMGPLRVLAPARRQMRALEQLANHGLAAPQSSGALEQVAAQLGALSGRLVAVQEAAVAAQKQGFTQLLAELRGELGQLAGDAGAALHARVAPLVEQAIARTGEAVTKQADALAATSRQLAQQLAGDASARKREAGELVAAFSQRERAVLERLEAMFSAGQREASELADALAQRERALLGRFEADQGARGQQAEQLIASLAQRERAVLERLDAQAGAQQREAGALIEALREHERELLARVEAFTSRIGGDLERLSLLDAAQSDQRDQRERAHDERAGALMQRLDASAAQLERSVRSQDEAIRGLVEQVGARFAQLSELAQAGATAALARIEQGAAEQAERFAALEATLDEARAAHAQGLGRALSGQAERLEQKLGDSGAVVQQAAAVLQAASAELQAVGELFAKSVERQREAADAWLESLGEVESAVERAGRHAAADALSDQLASTQEVFARQLQFQRELFEQLRGLRAGHARAGHGEHDVSV